MCSIFGTPSAKSCALPCDTGDQRNVGGVECRYELGLGAR